MRASCVPSAFLFFLVVQPALSEETTLVRDTFSDTWTATDALGRTLPSFKEAGAPRADRFVGLFYFLWLGEHADGKGPFDNMKILAKDPQALKNPNSPPWGPMHAFHHWGESQFGYYQTDDPFVLRKHAQMLSDAGVDAIIFDVTNQITYKRWYMALLKTFDEVRRDGGRTPQVAFLCPFWDPNKVVTELWRDLYEPGLYPDLWFRWEGKPLIMADPDKLADATNVPHNTPAALETGHTLGQTFTVEKPLQSITGSFPTWQTTDAAMTLTLYQDGPKGKQLARKRFEKVADNGSLGFPFDPPLPPGTYYLEMSEPSGKVGWWSHTDDVLPKGQAFADGTACAGDRSVRVAAGEAQKAGPRQFFTFRKPQPDYFQGPTGPDQWGWLEIFPQHVFKNSKGEKEQMVVGVGQNAVGRRLGSMSERDACGRSFHDGKRDTSSDAMLKGLNVAEQWERALKEDPKFIFITGWNEWIAMRFNEFCGVKEPVMFVDQFDQEHSRDIEPMKGGHGDNYYYQMVSYIRRYKGVRPPPALSEPKSIRLDAGFEQWKDVAPEYRDDAGDTAHRDHPGYNNHTRYVNKSGRNDLILLKVARDKDNLYFYARTREPLTPSTDPNWMMLFINIDRDHQTGWNGYDFVVNRTMRGKGVSVIERNAGGWKWEAAGDVKFVAAGHELHLTIPRASLGVAADKGPLRIEFKWADNVPDAGNIADFIDQGDVAPTGRFNYVYEEK
jgi:hypothetical protein